MIKKILLIFIIFSFVFACGKKGDPIYKESKMGSIKMENSL